jgi:hypothetical protein
MRVVKTFCRRCQRDTAPRAARADALCEPRDKSYNKYTPVRCLLRFCELARIKWAKQRAHHTNVRLSIFIQRFASDTAAGFSHLGINYLEKVYNGSLLWSFWTSECILKQATKVPATQKHLELHNSSTQHTCAIFKIYHWPVEPFHWIREPITVK